VKGLQASGEEEESDVTLQLCPFGSHGSFPPPPLRMTFLPVYKIEEQHEIIESTKFFLPRVHKHMLKFPALHMSETVFCHYWAF
jgi:hypothetical protein